MVKPISAYQLQELIKQTRKRFQNDFDFAVALAEELKKHGFIELKE